MGKQEIMTVLLNAMRKHETSVIERLNLLLLNIPSDAQKLNLTIFPTQDGDGMFTIYAGVEGRDLYVLNKSISAFANIFDPRYTPEGIVPFVPTYDPDDFDFDMNEVVVDTISKWLESIWQQVKSESLRIPVSVNGDEGQGTVTPLILRN